MVSTGSAKVWIGDAAHHNTISALIKLNKAVDRDMVNILNEHSIRYDRHFCKRPPQNGNFL